MAVIVTSNGGLWGRRHCGFVSAAVLLLFMLYCVPEKSTKSVKIGEVTVLNCAAGLVLCLVAAKCVGRRTFSRPVLVGLCLAWCLFGALALVPKLEPDFEWRTLVGDAVNLAAVPAGLAYWLSVDKHEGWINMQRVARASLVLGILIVAGLIFGFIDPLYRGRRPLVWSLFNATWIVGVLAPMLAIRHPEAADPVPWLRNRGLWASYLMLLFVFLFTGTRSVGFQSLLSMGAAKLVCGGRLKTVRILILIGLAAAGLVVADVEFVKDRVELVQERMTREAMARDLRSTEAEGMLSQMGSYILLGAGFGSTFHTPIVWEYRDTTPAPHIGILTFALKGGVIGAVVFVIAPLAWAACQLCRRTTSIEQRLGASGIILYVAFASMSGGWTFFTLFLYGVSLAMSIDTRRERVPAIEPDGPMAYAAAATGSQ